MTLATFTPDALPHWDPLMSALCGRDVRPEYSTRAHVEDNAGLLTPARTRQRRCEREAARSAAGLVSVPTSDMGAAPAPVAACELRLELEAFTVDRALARLSELRMHVGFAARAHAVSEKGRRSDVPWLVTLTYRGTNYDWEGRHISDGIKCMREWARRRGFALRYTWVAELQKRGVIHYHVAVWLPRGVRMPKWDVRGWWPHGWSNRKVARHATAYLMKYLSKGTEGTLGSFPKGARLYGVGGLDHSLRRARRWLRLPAFVQGNSSIADDWRPATGGGWVDPDGVIWPSEFTRVWIAGVECFSRVCTHPRSIDAAGPFSWLVH